MKLALLTAVLVLAACGPTPSTPTPQASVAPSSAADPTLTTAVTPVVPPLSFELSCGPMEQSECEAAAARIAKNASERYPDKTIVSIAITGPDGDYDLFFADGTGIGAHIN